MAKQNKIEAEKRQSLEALGLQVPKSELLTRRLYLWVTEGAHSFVGEQNKDRRVEMARKAQDAWVGKRVASGDDYRGTVEAIMWVAPREQSSHSKGTAPYDLMVRWDEDAPRSGGRATARRQDQLALLGG